MTFISSGRRRDTVHAWLVQGMRLCISKLISYWVLLIGLNKSPATTFSLSHSYARGTKRARESTLKRGEIETEFSSLTKKMGITRKGINSLKPKTSWARERVFGGLLLLWWTEMNYLRRELKSELLYCAVQFKLELDFTLIQQSPCLPFPLICIDLLLILWRNWQWSVVFSWGSSSTALSLVM